MNGDEATTPVVCVGASAGGIEALEAFFRHLPSDTGAAFVVITHLNPSRASFLHEIIARYTRLPVSVAQDGVRLRANTVHVMPPHATLTMLAGRLITQPSDPNRRERKPIDLFMSTLARDQGESSVAVILSGGDGDGTLGVKAVKELGGLTMAQVGNGDGPSHPSMPESAIATGMVDFAIPAAEMGSRIAAFVRTLAAPDDDKVLAEDARQQIYALLRTQNGHEFAGYKMRTFQRRVHRRMQVSQCESLGAYVERLRQDPAEVTALFRDLLINVTGFFRDADAFAALEAEVIPRLLDGRGADETVRVWVPACSTGEEVFSIAMLLRERIDGSAASPRLQIFATDIDDHALSVARAGRYPEALLDGVSAERKRRFFVADGASFMVARDIRDLCVFSPHSLIRDPPFSRIDLVSCRNLLIYFGAEVQTQVVPIFHYALRPGGYLFLGTSENISQFTDLFTPVEKKHRIFRSREDTPARLPSSLGLIRPAAVTAEHRARSSRLSGTALRLAAEAQVMARFSPAYVVTTAGGEIVFFSGKTGKYLELPSGLPSGELIDLARRGLRLDLRTAFRAVVETGRRVVRQHLEVEGDDGRSQMVTLTVERLSESQDGRFYLVVFADEGPSIGADDPLDRAELAPDEASELHRELYETRERLQSVIEEYDSALEELKSSNEELVSVNEEMQSANEELEPSKEELQSLNEELHTVNAELHTKIEALDRANSDLENLFESSQIATIFLDRALMIRSFTPAVARVFNVLQSDRGRPLTDLASRLPLPTLGQDVESVFAGGPAIERRIETFEAGAPSGAHFLVRIVPYRNSRGVSEGVVLTFVDVSLIATEAENHQRVLIAELNHRVKNMLGVVVAICDQTVKTSPELPAFRTAFVARLHAMARAYELLSRENWTEASLDEMIRQELAPFGLDRSSVTGPEVRFKPKQAMSVGLVMHELATNAGKYGGLSVAEGRVSVRWDVRGDRVTLEWRESNGPPVPPPTRRGFGLKLVERETQYSLGGTATVAFPPDGVKARIEITMAEGVL